MSKGANFTQELADEICRRISAGQSLRQVCKDPAMPNKDTVLTWARDKPEFRAQYVLAREMLNEHWADEIMDIADEAVNDFTIDDDGNKVVDHENIQRSRLRVDTRKWILSKLQPKKYGDKLELSGSLALSDRMRGILDSDSDK